MGFQQSFQHKQFWIVIIIVLIFLFKILIINYLINYFEGYEQSIIFSLKTPTGTHFKGAEQLFPNVFVTWIFNKILRKKIRIFISKRKIRLKKQKNRKVTPSVFHFQIFDFYPNFSASNSSIASQVSSMSILEPVTWK